MYDYYKVKDKGVIAMTSTCGAGRNFLFRLLKTSIGIFNFYMIISFYSISITVVFEEAAEIMDAHIVACLTPFTQHIILIGDHKQLQPMLISSPENNVSLFERMVHNNINLNTLNIQYRMRKEIADLIRPIIYKDLNDGQVVSSYPEIRGMRHNLYFLTHTEMETGNSDVSL